MTTTQGDLLSAHLAEGYRRCATITREHGTTYFWGAVLLPKPQRRHVHAVYTLCRLADDIVDAPGATSLADEVPATRAALARFRQDFLDAFAEPEKATPELAAVATTIAEQDIPLECFDRFFAAMEQDLTVTEYPTWEDLRAYMEGSAAVIGEMMLPVLRPISPAAREPARDLGVAFQLTNFLRDVGEDLDRGRVYLPREDLERFGADPHARTVDDAWRAMMAFQLDRTRELYRSADRGLALLPPAPARCVGTARTLYSGILDLIEGADYDVFGERLRVPTARKALTAVTSFAAAPRAATAEAHTPDRRPTADDAQPDRTVTPQQDGAAMTTPDPASPTPTGRDASTLAARVRAEVSRRVPISRVPEPPLHRIRPTWQHARVGRIERSLASAQQRDPGGWHVVGASTDLGTEESITRTVLGREVVLWRDGDRVLAGPGACPHMGALLDRCPVFEGVLHCRWHGMPLDESGRGEWRTFPARDDGALLWVRLATPGEEFTDEPTITPRPPLDESIIAVIHERLTCEPRDVVANRLDPWHGAWFHPYAFSHLEVDDEASNDEVLVADVTFRLNRTWGVPVRAEFRCPDARTIVMTIVEGEGKGSVVETHATELGVDEKGQPVTMMTEVTVAHSERPGFAVARWAGPLIRPLMKRTAAQLWVDDGEYAQRRHQLR